MLTSIILALEALFVLTFYFIGRSKYANFMDANEYPYKLKHMQPVSLLFLDQLKLMERYPDFTALVHHKLLLLDGRRNSLNGTKMYVAEMISASLCNLFVFTLFAVLANNDLYIFGFGLLGAMVTPLLLVRELSGKIRKKQQLMIMELPEILNSIILLVGAGETLKQAWLRCAEERRDKHGGSPLMQEFAVAAHELEMNVSFTKVMEGFSKRCSLQEVSLFTSTLLLNYKRGGSDLVHALQSLSQELWLRRKALSRTLGEEASSKLVFPMVMIFVVVMVIVASPALLMMNQ